ncbi:hypothetical protein [Dasania marina]|uniref:hypothetical protein n=1 Tax=Dasania marina TaxID=471499 RepID=UPI00036F02B9|nr:hypothetical protein [Dasania marina]
MFKQLLAALLLFAIIAPAQALKPNDIRTTLASLGTETIELTKELVTQYQQSERTGNHSAFNKWRNQHWVPKLENTEQKYQSYYNNNRPELFSYSSVFNSLRSLELASLDLVWKANPDTPTNYPSFRTKVHAIARQLGDALTQLEKETATKNTTAPPQ